MASKKTCPACGSSKVRTTYPKEYKYENCGLSDIVLCGRGVEIRECPSCEFTFTCVSEEQQLLQFMGLNLLTAPLGMKGYELRYLRTMFGMTQKEMADEMMVSRRETVADWEAKKGSAWSRLTEELGVRLVLVGLFRTHVIESDRCFLAPSQIEDFEESEASFSTLVKEFRETKPAKKCTVSIRHRPIKKEWESTESCCAS